MCGPLALPMRWGEASTVLGPIMVAAYLDCDPAQLAVVSITHVPVCLGIQTTSVAGT